MNIICSSATSLSSLMEKVIFYCTFVFGEPCKVYKVKKVRKTIFGPNCLKFSLQKIDKGLES